MKRPTSPSRILILILIACFASATLTPSTFGQTDFALTSYRNYNSRICPILDSPFEADASLAVGHVMAAGNTAPAWNNLSVTEIDAWLRYFLWENDTGGELDMRATFNCFVLRNFADASSGYPLIAAALPFTWSQRYEDGYGLQAELQPGIYSSFNNISGEALGIPMGFRLIKAMNPDTAIFAGARIYPGFDRTIDPWIGFHWSDRSIFSVDLAYPETKLSVGPRDGRRFTLGCRMLLWPEYDMGSDDDREIIRYDETRVYIGVAWSVNELFGISLQAGSVLNRELSFESTSDPVEIDDSGFIQFSIHTIM